MKKIPFIIKFAGLITIVLFLFIILTLNFILIPKTFVAISQIVFKEKDDDICSIFINVSKEQKISLDQRVISIYFINRNEYKNILANNWIDNQLIILETKDYNAFINQKLIITYKYERLLSYILNNIS